jgi:hypothetical protein
MSTYDYFMAGLFLIIIVIGVYLDVRHHFGEEE